MFESRHAVSEPERDLDRESASSGAPAATGEILPHEESAAAVGSTRRIGLFRRFFWLEDQVAAIAPSGFSVNQPGWAEFELARHARTGSRWLKEAAPPSSAGLLLERIQLHLLVRSTLKLHGHCCTQPYLTETDWAAAGRIESLAKLLANLTSNELDVIKACLGKDGDLCLVGMNVKQRRVIASSLFRANQLLGDPLDLYEGMIRRIKSVRWLRIGAGIVVLSALVVTANIGISAYRHRANLAFHRPVTISSRAPFVSFKESQVVDGDTSNLGFHTNNDPNPFAVIDLGAPKQFDKVVVYNRADCCQDRAVPLFIDVSNDGVTFDNVAERTEIFEKWTAANLNAKGRYVRLRSNSSNYFHLAEVEIY
jgi:hypothetical protein